MNALERSLIEKAGYNNGFENVRESSAEGVTLSSSRHKTEARIGSSGVDPNDWNITFTGTSLVNELARSFATGPQSGSTFQAHGASELWRLLRRAAELAMSLPNQAAEAYTEEIAKIEANPPTTTEALAIVKQRRGQELFRKALMDYWGGACAVTGITVPELLRASHAKPWADCESDEERLNVFNGFLLCAHLDALFDRGLMTFGETGTAVFSETIDATTRELLNLPSGMKLRWMATEHGAFLQWHRERVCAAI